MTEFIDSKGNHWALILTLGSAKKILDKTGVDLLNPTSLIKINDDESIGEDSVILRLLTDDLFVGDIIYNLIEKQAQDRGLTKDDVFDMLDGETTKKAYDAFTKEYRNFFMARGNVQGVKMIDLLIQGIQALAEESNGEKSSNSQDAQESKTFEN